jgi:hypothetical protein
LTWIIWPLFASNVELRFIPIESEFNIVLQAPKFYGSSMEDLLWNFYWNSTKVLRRKLDNVQDLCCMQKVEALVCSSSMAWKFWSSWKNWTMQKEIYITNASQQSSIVYHIGLSHCQKVSLMTKLRSKMFIL